MPGLNIGELFVALGFDVDDKKLNAFNDKFKAGVSDVRRYSDQVREFGQGTFQNATAMKNFGDQTNYSTQALQRWSVAASTANPAISIDEASNAYERLGKELTKIRQGGGAAGVLAQLGVDFHGTINPDEALEELLKNRARIIKERGKDVYTDLLDQLQLGAGWDRVLSKTPQEIDNLTRGKLLSQSEIERVNTANTAFNNIGISWNRSKSRMISNAVEDVQDPVGVMGQFWNWLSGKSPPNKDDKESQKPSAKNITNQQESANFWTSQGFSRKKVAGFLATEQAESGFVPQNALDSDGKIHSGSFQWSPERRAKILKGTGIDVSSADHLSQLKAAMWEMRQMGVLQRVMSGPDSERYVADLLTRKFEMPRNTGLASEKRQDMASAIAARTIQQTNNITITGVTEPHETAAAVESVLKKQMSLAGSTLNLGPDF